MNRKVTNVSKSLTLLCFLLLGLVVRPETGHAQALPTWLWTVQAGGPDWTRPMSVAADKQGNIIVVGEFFGLTSFGATTFTSTPSNIPSPFAHSDIFIAKYTAAGKLRWVRAAGGAGHDFASQVATDTDGSVYVTGKFGEGGTTRGLTATFGSTTLTSRGNGEMFLAKYDSTGLLRWVRQADRLTNDNYAYSQGMHVAVDTHHNVYWAGIYSGAVTIASTTVSGLGDQSICLAKLTPSGTVRWLRSGMCRGEYGGASVRLAIDSQDHVYCAGNMASTATFGSYVFSNLSGGYTNDVFVARYDSLGTVQWAKQLGGTQRDNLSDIAVTPTGNVQLGITFEGTASFTTQSLTSRGGQDIALACFTGAGQLSWLRQEGGSANETGFQLAIDERNTCYALGFFTDLPDFNAPPIAGSGSYSYLLSYDSMGTRKWALPQPAFNYGWTGGSMQAVAALRLGTLIVAGNFKGTATFPGLPPIASSTPASTLSSGQLNLWVAKLSTAAGMAPIIVPPVVVPPIVVEPPTSPDVLVIPNIITPNGDAYNEQFIIKGLKPNTSMLTIYSRWGQQVYHTDSYNQDWNAQGLSTGLYYYSLQPAGRAALTGWVEVVR